MPVDPKILKIDPDTGDILPTPRRRLGDYLSSRTQAQDIGGEFSPGEYAYAPLEPNTYPVKPSSTLLGTNESGLFNSSRNGQQTFTSDDQSLLQNFEPSQLDLNEPASESSVKQILNDADAIDRDRAVRDISDGISDNEVSKAIQKKINRVLQNNRFTKDQQYTQSLSVPVTTRDLGQATNLSEASNAFDEMRKFGVKNTLLATGIPARELEDPDALTEAQSIAPDWQSLLNGLLQTSVEDFKRDGLSESKIENIPSAGLFGNRKELNSTTQGQLNSYLEPFGGAFPTSMTLNASILVTAMAVGALSVASLFALSIKSIDRVDYTAGNFAIKGKSYPAEKELTTRIQDIRKFFADELNLITPKPPMKPLYSEIEDVDTTNENKRIIEKIASQIEITYLNSVIDGLAAFIGIDSTNVTSQQSLTALTNIIGGAGYYVIMARNVIRNLDTYGNVVASSFGTGQGLISGIQGSATILAELKTNKLIRFVDTMARLGMATSQFLDDETLELMESGDISRIDLTKQNAWSGALREPAALASKRVSSGRRVKGSRELSHSFMSIDDNILKLITNDAESSTVQIGKNKPTLSTLDDIKVQRISDEDAQKIEDQLDAEYVPFYFKDLRTNEILAFHAFISELSDSYSSDWNDTTAYGRMDPVQTYKNTTRSISFSFHIVSTSPKDFDRMWWAINKLTTMVYPQWSRGEEIENKSERYKLLQPFSQVLSSSPIIRIRIGDLISSNYSRFNLSRIFGVGEDGIYERQLSDNEFAKDDSNNAIIRAFESAGGKGLAGSIRSLSYDWYNDETLWETKKGSRAPTVCRVNIQFNPIHDIPMGLDHNGMNRAPAYPVGNLVRNMFFPDKKKE